eukprot:11214061-Lingulodinium_polyedra.AAC.1
MIFPTFPAPDCTAAASDPATPGARANKHMLNHMRATGASHSRLRRPEGSRQQPTRTFQQQRNSCKEPGGKRRR